MSQKRSDAKLHVAGLMTAGKSHGQMEPRVLYGKRAVLLSREGTGVRVRIGQIRLNEIGVRA